MNWFSVALLAALATATGDALLKARFGHLSVPEMAVVRATGPLPLLVPVLLVRPWPDLDATFWYTVVLLLPLEILALFLYMRALRVSPLSLTIPFLAFTPVLIVLTGWVILGEQPDRWGLAGIICTVAGGYILHLKESRRGLLEPFRCIGREEGSRLMLVVAAVYAVTSVLGKRAILHSEPVFFACFYFVLLGVVVPAVSMPLLLRGPNVRVVSAADIGHPAARQQFTWLAWCGVGFTQAVMVLSHMWAINLVAAAYMIAVKRTSLLFSVILGRLVFGEGEIVQRLAGAVLMVLGVGLILLAR